MRIAYLVSSFPSVSETFILNQITGLIDFGHEVDIYALRKNVQEKWHEDILKYDLLNKVEYIHEFMIKPLERKIKQEGNYDIVHCHFGPLGKFAVNLKLCGLLDSKIVVSFHGYDMSSYIQDHGCHVYDEIFEYADYCLPISEYWKERLIELGCPKEKLLVHHMGVDPNKFIYKIPVFKGKDESLNLLTVSRFVEKKGIRYGVEAVSNLLKLGYRINYQVVGHGPLFNEITDLIVEENCQESIQLLGWKTQEEINALLSQCDVLLAPSVTAMNGDMEGIPVVIMEAMSRGIPVVSTIHSGIPEIVVNGVTGFLVEERDVIGLTNKLQILCDSFALREKFGKASRKKIEAEYNIHTLNKELSEIFGHVNNNEQIHIPSALLVVKSKERSKEQEQFIRNKVFLYDKCGILEIYSRQKNKKIYIFGASSMGDKVYKELKNLDVHVDGFIDNNRDLWGEFIHGLKVESPSSLSRDVFIFVASNKYAEITDQLVAEGYSAGRSFLIVCI